MKTLAAALIAAVVVMGSTTAGAHEPMSAAPPLVCPQELLSLDLPERPELPGRGEDATLADLTIAAVSLDAYATALEIQAATWKEQHATCRERAIEAATEGE